jgi:hypothetical protein
MLNLNLITHLYITEEVGDTRGVTVDQTKHVHEMVRSVVWPRVPGVGEKVRFSSPTWGEDEEPLEFEIDTPEDIVSDIYRGETDITLSALSVDVSAEPEWVQKYLECGFDIVSTDEVVEDEEDTEVQEEP